MKFTRTVELYLIDVGLQSVLDNLVRAKSHPPKKKMPGKKWTKAQREKFSKTMQKKWAERNKE